MDGWQVGAELCAGLPSGYDFANRRAILKNQLTAITLVCDLSVKASDSVGYPPGTES